MVNYQSSHYSIIYGAIVMTNGYYIEHQKEGNNIVHKNSTAHIRRENGIQHHEI